MNKDFLKEFATAFFYKWYNSPGTNTEQGFESWYDTEEAQSILSKHGINTHVSEQSEQLPPQETALWKEVLGYNAELQMQLGRSSQNERVVKLAEKYAVTRR